MERWLAYFANKLNQQEKEELAMLNPEIAEAMDASERYLMDETAYREYLQRESAIWDYNSDIIGSREEGREEGRVEEKQNMIIRMSQKGKSLEEVSDLVEWPADKINDFLRSRNLPTLR